MMSENRLGSGRKTVGRLLGWEKERPDVIAFVFLQETGFGMPDCELHKLVHFFQHNI